MALSIYDEDQNPARVVLGTYDTIGVYVQSVKAAEKRWPRMKPVDRARHHFAAAGAPLKRLGIPWPLKTGWIVGLRADAIFYRRTWEIRLRSGSMDRAGKKDIAKQASYVLHEFEHLATVYMAARHLAATGADSIAKKLDIPLQIAQRAAKDPLPADNKGAAKLGQSCLFRATADKGDPSSPDKSYYGRLKSRLSAAKARAVAAEKRADALEKRLPDARREYFRAMDKLRQEDRRYQITYRKYRASAIEMGSTLVENLVKSALLR